MFGLAWNGILSALRDPDEKWQPMAGGSRFDSAEGAPQRPRTRRACFVLGVAVMLGATVVIVAASNGPPRLGSPNPSRDSIWIYCLGCAVPITLLAFRFSHSALVRPALGAVGTLLAVVVLAASGEAFRAYGRPLNGLAAYAHDHHALVIAAVLVPFLLVTLACLPLRRHRAVEFSAHPAP
jgi:hypothetical protein